MTEEKPTLMGHVFHVAAYANKAKEEGLKAYSHAKEAAKLVWTNLLTLEELNKRVSQLEEKVY